MKKFQLIATLVLGLSAASQAQFLGAGWDGRAEEIVGRIGLGGYSTVEVGVGLRFDDTGPDATVAQEDLRSNFSISARYMHALHAWEQFTGYLNAGLYFRDDNNLPDSPNRPFGGGNARAAGLALFGGYMPEIVLLQHLAVSTTFGLSLPIMPDFKIGFVGDEVSIVSGLSFRILW